jgi:DNA-binding NtrC family response regulator
LRARKEDIYQLARAFAVKYGDPKLGFTFSFLVALVHYHWPFNVRELESCIKRGVALADGAPLDTRQLPDAISEYMRGYGVRDRPPLQASAFPPARTPDARVPDQGPPQARPAEEASAPLPPSALPSAEGRRGAPTEEELRGLLARHHGNVAAVGRELGKERMQVHRWLKKYEISLEEYREP